MNKKIVLIHNTDYHFETLISVYQTIKDINYDPYIYICKNVKPKFNQYEFINKLNLSLIDIDDVSDALGCLIMSVYPDPYAKYEHAIPNEDDCVFQKIQNKVNICHRFKNIEDYLTKKFHKDNCICLSPLSAKIGIDHINLIDMPIKPNNSYQEHTLKLTIQARFELNNRDPELLKILFSKINNVNNKKIIINLIGTNTEIAGHIARNNINNTNIQINNYNNLTEESFYGILNEQTDWLIPCVSPSSKKGTYFLERYSSNFNHAMALEKPILCHKAFENIYNIPGIYYLDDYEQACDKLVQCDNDLYQSLINKFLPIKKTLATHNETILKSKLKI